MSDPQPAQRVAEEADALARQLLRLGWVVRSPHPTGDDPLPLLLVSRTAFDASPTTVYILPHHHLELQAHTGVPVDVEDLEDLHHHLNDWQRHRNEAW